MNQSLKHWIWLSGIKKIGAVTALRLINHFGSPEKVFSAVESDYLAVEGINFNNVGLLLDKKLDNANLILTDCAEIGCHVLTIHDKEYPQRLKNIYDAPILLYIRGKLPSIDEEPVIGVVGTRDCTPYGWGVAKTIGHNLSKRGVIISTGLAKGIDSAAAQGALMSGGSVIGVIGTGLGTVYPPENKKLFDDVAHRGAIISEYPPKATISKQNFPMRNRLIAGISLGVTVIEAPKRSGALITALQALEQGRDVFVVPGNVNLASCEGSNALLRDGAIPVLSADDIVNEYIELYPDKITRTDKEIKPFSGENNTANDSVMPRSKSQRAVTINKKEIDKKLELEYIDVDRVIEKLCGDEKKVAEVIGSGKEHIDDIIKNSGLSAQSVLTALTLLEIKGYVQQASGKIFSIIDNGK